MNRRRIAVQCNGSLQLGMGHVMRTLVIAEELKREYDVYYICKSDSEYEIGVEAIHKFGYPVSYEMENTAADMLILDSYDVTEHKLSMLRRKYGRLMYIDDVHELGFYDCDILLNRNLGAEEITYKTTKECKVLLGMQYALLRKEFRECDIPLIGKKVEIVLITMGGSDPKSTSLKVLDIVKEAPFLFQVVVGNGFAAETVESLKKMAVGQKNVELYYNPDMAQLMSRCDFAITACGGTIYELSALGIPHMAVSIAPNQESGGDVAKENELHYYVGREEGIQSGEFLEVFQSLTENYEKRKYFSDNQKKRVNRNGVELVVKEVRNIMDSL